MKTIRRFTLHAVLALAVMIVFSFSGTVYASDDNSLSDLGITTQGVTVSPDNENTIITASASIA